MDFSTLAKLRQYLTIKHHIPGRIRIKFDQAIAKHPQARELVHNSTSLPPGVSGLRLNALARSVVIEYSHRSIPPELLEELIATREDARAEQLLRELHAILKTINSKEVH